MTAAQHSAVWKNVAERLLRMAEEAKIAKADNAETTQLQFAVFAASIAAAYQDSSIGLIS